MLFSEILDILPIIFGYIFSSVGHIITEVSPVMWKTLVQNIFHSLLVRKTTRLSVAETSISRNSHEVFHHFTLNK